VQVITCIGRLCHQPESPASIPVSDRRHEIEKPIVAAATQDQARQLERDDGFVLAVARENGESLEEAEGIAQAPRDAASDQGEHVVRCLDAFAQAHETEALDHPVNGQAAEIEALAA
jgi:hypothetical protein